MADPDSDHPLPSAAPKGNMVQISSNITKLTESRQELLSRIQNLKQDLQNWKGKMDTQVKVYHSELSELKSSLNTEVEQLRSEFQELRTTLQQQQQDIGISLKTLGLHDEGTKAGEDFKNVETSSVTGHHSSTPSIL